MMAQYCKILSIPHKQTMLRKFKFAKSTPWLWITGNIDVSGNSFDTRYHHSQTQTSKLIQNTTAKSSHCMNCLKLRLESNGKPFHSSLFSQQIRAYSTADDYSDDEADRPENKLDLPDAELDWKYILDPQNTEEIRQNIVSRKGVGNIDEVMRLWNKYKEWMHWSDKQPKTGQSAEDLDVDILPFDISQIKDEDESKIMKDLLEAALLLPNTNHPDSPIGDESAAKVVEVIGEGHKKEFDFTPRTVADIGESLDALRTSDTTLTTGHGTYYLQGQYAELEQALIRYIVLTLRAKGFKMMSVPDLIYPQIIEGCGFKTTGERNQVYRLESKDYGRDVCLAGTGEMPLAAFSMNYTFTREQLPQKVMTVSRCYRAETSSVEEEKGIYRVHQFTKVEMFGITENESGQESEKLFEEILQIQKELFEPLGVCFRILEMPSQELGAPAHRKYDIEAWMPAKGIWGEVSSTSNCTDYQSRRLSIKYWDQESVVKHCHTVNGTACAIPRMITAIVESNQQKDLSVNIPAVLQPYMDGQTALHIPDQKVIMKPIKFTKTLKKNLKQVQR